MVAPGGETGSARTDREGTREQDALEVQAHAKINLSLEVLGKRPDGFHELVSVMQTVTLHDTLSFLSQPDIGPGPDSGQGISIVTNVAIEDASNLVTTAAVLLRERTGTRRGCRVHLEKRIPIAAGLGGGSSDAAATLRGLCGIWNLQLSAAELTDLAATLGSDVPFFLTGGTALIRGRGEEVEPLLAPAEQWYLLVNPGIEVSTKSVFEGLPPQAWTAGSISLSVARSVQDEGRSRFGINGLQDTLFALYPEAQRCFQTVTALAPGEVIVTGSGPTVVASCGSVNEATALQSRLEGTGYGTSVVASYDGKEEQT